MSKSIIIIVIVLVLVLAGGLIFWQKNKQMSQNAIMPTPNSAMTNSASAAPMATTTNTTQTNGSASVSVDQELNQLNTDINQGTKDTETPTDFQNIQNQ